MAASPPNELSHPIDYRLSSNFGSFLSKPASRPDLGPSYLQWDIATARIAELASLPFLLMQVPQIVLNTRNLLAGNYTALAAVQWKAQLTSLAGNLSLMSYFVHKRERGATIVQAVGVITTLVVLIQLAIADAMPINVLIATAMACAVGFTVSILHYWNYLTAEIWRAWQDIIGVVGLFVLCQMVWSTFELFLPSSVFPGVIAAAIDVILIILVYRSILGMFDTRLDHPFQHVPIPSYKWVDILDRDMHFDMLARSHFCKGSESIFSELAFVRLSRIVRGKQVIRKFELRMCQIISRLLNVEIFTKEAPFYTSASHLRDASKLALVFCANLFSNSKNL